MTMVEIKNVLDRGVIKESQHEEGEYISPILLTPKSDGSFRMILNFKKLYDHMLYIRIQRVSYQLTGLDPQKNFPKKQKVKLLTLTCFFLKSKFNESPKDFSINYSLNNKCGTSIFSF